MNKNIKILVVEDDGPIRNLISTALQTNQYKYDLSVNGEKALLHYQPIIMI